MHPRRTTKLDHQLYRIIDQRATSDRIYQLVRFSLSGATPTKRRRVLKRVLEDSDALGLIEWWERGSIVHKPWSRFHAILIVDKPSNESAHPSPDVSQ